MFKLVEDKKEKGKGPTNPPTTDGLHASTNNSQEDEQLVQDTREYVRKASQARQAQVAERIRYSFRVAPPRNMPCSGYMCQPSVHSRINTNVPSTSRGITNRNLQPGLFTTQDLVEEGCQSLKYKTNLRGAFMTGFVEEEELTISQLNQKYNWSAQGFPEENNDYQWDYNY